MRKTFLIVAGIAGLATGAVMWWRRNPRVGSGWVNRAVDPWLVERGVVDKSDGEIGLIEHVGRRSGTVRISPVHPVPTDDGFRIIVPLGLESHWARNVLAAGHCRLQVGEIVHELDEPALIAPTAVRDIPAPAARVMEWLGFRYLTLRRFGESPGSLGAPLAADATNPAEPEDETARSVSVAMP